MSYKKNKQDYLKSSSVSSDFLQGMEIAEQLVEHEIREIIGPYTELMHKLNRLIDTKRPEVRDEIFKWILENPETMKKLNKNVDNLINIIRI